MWQYNGEVIKTAKEMVINDVRYPKQIFKDADLLAELGITSYTPEAVADQRYYSNSIFGILQIILKMLLS